MAQNLTAIRTAAPADPEVEAVLAEFDGDPRRAIRALLDDIAALAEDAPAETYLTVAAAVAPDSRQPGWRVE
ncbi:MAG: hypothetical protein Q8O26_00010 [Phreatobacter sp.]|uniref:hypothetical protein n=1 Tax=Phreatobacter sp. TaxID=1966341 RepID=UPI0027336C96|nr:hypothetical protein [Phreatobacter sp.]MDP2800246.1 hypothetical protein [Phreatobacter sp.]